MTRIAGKGLPDRKAPVKFTFDGAEYSGFQGDTIASALLASETRLVGRSFKYHRPRGIMTAGPEEPAALVEIVSGDQVTPNVRATVQEIYDGLEARSQNRFPSLRFDLYSINDFLAPFLGAGFYYKTFMWPSAFWERVYEPFIRRAAGLGSLSGAPDTALYDKAFAHCDLLVIGSGPAGLSAALTAARAGVDVIVAEEDFEPGGRLKDEIEQIDGMAAGDWVDMAVDELHRLGNVRFMLRSSVTGVYDGGTYGLLQRVSEHLADPPEGIALQTFWRVAARRSVLASGATERMIAFQNNDRPGIMTAGAVRAYLNRYGVVAGKKPVLFTNNDFAYRTARDLLSIGVEVQAIVDTRAESRTSLELPHYPGSVVTNTAGRLGVSQVTIRTGAGESIDVPCDCLAVSGGWDPNVHLSCHLGAKPVWIAESACFGPSPKPPPGMSVAGSALGSHSTHAALKSGHDAAREGLKALGAQAPKAPFTEADRNSGWIEAFWHVPCEGKRAWVDFQNDVTVKDIQQAHQESFSSVEHMKRYTTQGMTTDQGKMSNVSALAILSGESGRSIPETGTTTYRPPYTPVSLGALGAHARGKGFQPERLTPSHEVSRKFNAPFIEAGLWHRPSWFPRAGESHWRQSCDREAMMVREAVGICDVSTLGKINIQGPGAGELLDRVYANRISNLPVGRIKYGIMLREDGHVMDDGTCARLGKHEYLMTTTTAAAAEVMSHLEFCSQVLWPDIDVRFVSVTDHWAQFAIAGPLSADLLNKCGTLSPYKDQLGFMEASRFDLYENISGFLYRISFSGEQGYELAVPASHGEFVFGLLKKLANEFGGDAYGMEALNVLRIEKGFLTHSEIHGRVTAFDLGLGGMISRDKDCIGKAASQRPGLLGEEREQLVGVMPVKQGGALHAGAQLFGRQSSPVRKNVEGYLTSACYSPVMKRMIALGFLRNGRERIGERIRMVDHLRSTKTEVEVCPHVFYDPKGERARG